jgi:hypothetical protein
VIRLVVIVGIVVASLAGTARADNDHEYDPTFRGITAAKVAEGVTELGDEIDAHLGALSAGVVSLKFDGRSRQIHLGFDLEGDNASFKFRSDVVVRGGVARIDARIDLRLVGRHVHVELPDVEVVPRSYDGDRYVEVRLPLLTGRF